MATITSIRLECGHCGAQKEWTLGDDCDDTEAVRKVELPPRPPAQCENCGETVPIDKQHLLLLLEGSKLVRATDL